MSWAACVLVAAQLFSGCTQEAEPRRFEDDGADNGSTQTSVSAGGNGATTSGVGGAGASGAAGPTTSAGGTGVTTTSASGGGCPNDQYESNNTEGSAHFLGTIDDCDSSALTVSAVLSGNDTDWFVYDGTDEFCSVTPSRTIGASGQARLCKFFDCGAYEEDVTCAAGTSAEQSPGGLPGCCGIGVVEPSINCLDTISDDASVYLRIDKPPAIPCVTYTIDLHY